MQLKNLIALWLILLFALSSTLLAKEYTSTSYYVAYDTADKKQYALVMPSVNKVYTHEAGYISDLKQIDTQFTTFPTYDNGELCFSALNDEASGEDGASVMEGQCYNVNFFYTQKEKVEDKDMAFILTYTTTDTVYEGLAGDALSFKVVRKGDIITNDNSVTGDDYTFFRFNIVDAKALGLTEKLVLNSPPVANAGTDQTIEVNQAINITGVATDTDGTIVSYEWKKEDTVLSENASFSYISTEVGTDTLTLTVMDDDEATHSDSMTVTITATNGASDNGP